MLELHLDLLEVFLGKHKKNNPTKSQISFDCPACAIDKGLFNGDGKGNLEVNYKKGVFKCWSCYQRNNMSGRIEKLISKYGNKKILSEYLLLKPETNYSGHTNEITPPKLISKLPKEYIKLDGEDILSESAFKYLCNERGLTEKIIDYYNIGYARTGKYKNRIIIPSYDDKGMINYFVTRTFDPLNKIKYLNPDADKELIIFNENKIKWDANLYLTEGVFDHMVIPNSIPLLGKYMYDVLLEKIYNNLIGNLIIVLDGDALEEANNLFNELNFCNLKNRVFMVNTPKKYDPSKIFEKMGYKGIYKLLRGRIKKK